MIDKFECENFFLSNFYPRAIVYKGHTFPSSENAYQAEKVPCDDWDQFLTITASQSKKLGRKVKIRSDWEQVKLSIMNDVLNVKFAIPDLRAMLLATGDQELIEGNTWGDTIWGTVNGVGQNNLGKLLMKIRAEIRLTQKLSS